MYWDDGKSNGDCYTLKKVWGIWSHSLNSFKGQVIMEKKMETAIAY